MREDLAGLDTAGLELHVLDTVTPSKLFGAVGYMLNGATDRVAGHDRGQDC